MDNNDSHVMYGPSYETVLKLKGKTDDLLNVSDDGSMVMTRLFKLESDTDVDMEEVIDVSITSVNPDGKHPIFDKLRGKNLKITIETEEKIGNRWHYTTDYTPSRFDNFYYYD